MNPATVISIDLSPAGSILATGSGDWQARICRFLLFPYSIWLLTIVHRDRELHEHLVWAQAWSPLSQQQCTYVLDFLFLSTPHIPHSPPLCNVSAPDVGYPVLLL